MSNERIAVQDWDRTRCFGCGSLNEFGLHIKSYRRGDECVCDWKAEAHHCAGGNVMYGGIVASLIDCHSAATAHSSDWEDEKGGDDSQRGYAYMTKKLSVEYLRPTLLDKSVQLRARVTNRQGRGAQVLCELYSGETLCARGDTLFVKVKRETVMREEG